MSEKLKARKTSTSARSKTPLPAAQRGRRKLKRAKAAKGNEAPREIGGRGGKDPARFGDWEIKGRVDRFLISLGYCRPAGLHRALLRFRCSCTLSTLRSGSQRSRFSSQQDDNLYQTWAPSDCVSKKALVSRGFYYFSVLAIFDQVVHDARIGQRRGIAQQRQLLLAILRRMRRMILPERVSAGPARTGSCPAWQ